MSAASVSEAPAPLAPRARLVGILCGVTVVLLFSGFTLVSRLGFASSLHATDIAALRFAVSGLLMAPVLLHYGLAGIRMRDLTALTFSGGLGFALLAYTGFSLAPAAHGGVLLHGTLPLFTCALAWLATAFTISRRRALGLAAILAGVVAMAWDSVAGSGMRQLLGDGALLLASICWSSYGLLARRLNLPPARSAAIVAVLSMVGYLPVYLILADASILDAPWPDLMLQALYQGVLIGAVSIFVYSKAVAMLGAIDTALFTAAVPVVTTLLAVLLLGEMPSTLAWTGVVVVTAGMAVAMGARQ